MKLPSVIAILPLSGCTAIYVPQLTTTIIGDLLPPPALLVSFS